MSTHDIIQKLKNELSQLRNDFNKKLDSMELILQNYNVKQPKKNNKPHKNEIVMYTDGSCKGAQTNRKCGIGVHFPNKEINDISEPLPVKLKPYTNQRAELYAIYMGIKRITKAYTFKKLLIKSDSQYSIMCSTEWIENWKKNGWKKSANREDVKNKDILQKIDKYMMKYRKYIKFEHVTAHSGIQGNEIADELANNGANLS
jgi:ribonuclease HI